MLTQKAKKKKKRIKNTQTYLNETMVEKQEWQKYMRWHFYIILLIIHGLLYIDYLHILYYLNLQLWNMNSEAAAGLFLKNS